MFRSRAILARLATSPLSRRALSSRTEFSISPYVETSELGFGRGTQFCLLSLLHPTFDGATATDESLKAVYAAKVQSAEAQVDSLFERYDTDASGALDARQLREAMAGIGLPPTDERVRSVLVSVDENRDCQLQRDEFSKLLLETWGVPVTVDFTDRLPLMYTGVEDGNRA